MINAGADVDTHCRMANITIVCRSRKARGKHRLHKLLCRTCVENAAPHNLLPDLYSVRLRSPNKERQKDRGIRAIGRCNGESPGAECGSLGTLER